MRPDREAVLAFLGICAVGLAFWGILLWAYVIGSR